MRVRTYIVNRCAEVAQSVEQRPEKPRVGGSIPPLGTTLPLAITLLKSLAKFLNPRKM